MKASEICEAAGKLVGGDRAATHGDKVANHQAIADLWNGYIKAKRHPGTPQIATPLDAEDVANMMELLKIARRLNGDFNPDDYIDGAGYAAVAGEIASRLQGHSH